MKNNNHSVRRCITAKKMKIYKYEITVTGHSDYMLCHIQIV